MKQNIELALNDFGNPRSCPQFGGKTERCRALAEPVQNQPGLTRCKFGRTSGVWFGDQATLAILTIGGHPSDNTAHMDAKKLSHLGLRMAILNSANTEKSAPFEFVGRTSCSHAKLYTWPLSQDNCTRHCFSEGQ